MLVLLLPVAACCCNRQQQAATATEINSGDKVLPNIGFKLPFLFNLNIGLCLNPKVVPAVGERFNLLLK